MSIPHCFDPLLSAKPKHPRVGALAQAAPQSVDEIDPLSQIPGLNLTQFNNIVRYHVPKFVPKIIISSLIINIALKSINN